MSRTCPPPYGVRSDGVLGFQGEVFTSTPAQPEVYSALTSNLKVTWNPGHNPVVLDSEGAILHAQDQGKVTLKELDVVINMPQIVWPEGQMLVKEDKTFPWFSALRIASSESSSTGLCPGFHVTSRFEVSAL